MFQKGKIFINIFCAVMILCSVGMVGVALSAELSSLSCAGGNVSDSDIIVATPTDVAKPQPEPETRVDSATIMMGGDVLIHDTVINRARQEDGSYDLSPYFSLFHDVFKADLNIVNLENPVDVNKDNSEIIGYPFFNAPREILDELVAIGVDLCVTANNHTFDQGRDGVLATLENVREAGLEGVGTNLSQEEADTPYIKEINGIKVGVIAYSTSGFKGITFEINDVKYTYDNVVEAVLADVEKLRSAGAEYIICSLHWGSEYVDEPKSVQERIAKAICEGGVDVLMGTHSHCVQPIELLEVERNGVKTNALVIYSLGNLFANQKGTNRPKTQQGMVVSIKIERGEDGIVRLADSFYMPTFCYVNTGKPEEFMRLVPAGECALAEEMPDYILFDFDWDAAKDAWKRVPQVVGDAIPHVASPEEYPEGFFE